DPAPHLEQVDDLQVLPRLRAHALVRGHDEDHGVEAVDAGKHVADEPRMAGHVDDPDLATARQPHVSEAEIDGHAPLLLLGEAVGVDAGQRGDEGRLAVVDVARGADDAAQMDFTAASTASSSVSSSPLRTVRGSMQQSPPSTRAITGGTPSRSAAM